jgi:hypothetical protein
LKHAALIGSLLLIIALTAGCGNQQGLGNGTGNRQQSALNAPGSMNNLNTYGDHMGANPFATGTMNDRIGVRSANIHRSTANGENGGRAAAVGSLRDGNMLILGNTVFVATKSSPVSHRLGALGIGGGEAAAQHLSTGRFELNGQVSSDILGTSRNLDDGFNRQFIGRMNGNTSRTYSTGSNVDGQQHNLTQMLNSGYKNTHAGSMKVYQVSGKDAEKAMMRIKLSLSRMDAARANEIAADLKTLMRAAKPANNHSNR